MNWHTRKMIQQTIIWLKIWREPALLSPYRCLLLMLVVSHSFLLSCPEISSYFHMLVMPFISTKFRPNITLDNIPIRIILTFNSTKYGPQASLNNIPSMITSPCSLGCCASPTTIRRSRRRGQRWSRRRGRGRKQPRQPHSCLAC